MNNYEFLLHNNRLIEIIITSIFLIYWLCLLAYILESGHLKEYAWNY
jgi:hypothetical protein